MQAQQEAAQTRSSASELIGVVDTTDPTWQRIETLNAWLAAGQVDRVQALIANNPDWGLQVQGDQVAEVDHVF